MLVIISYFEGNLNLFNFFYDRHKLHVNPHKGKERVEICGNKLGSLITIETTSCSNPHPAIYIFHREKSKQFLRACFDSAEYRRK